MYKLWVKFSYNNLNNILYFSIKFKHIITLNFNIVRKK